MAREDLASRAIVSAGLSNYRMLTVTFAWLKAPPI